MNKCQFCNKTNNRESPLECKHNTHKSCFKKEKVCKICLSKTLEEIPQKILSWADDDEEMDFKTIPPELLRF